MPQSCPPQEQPAPFTSKSSLQPQTSIILKPRTAEEIDVDENLPAPAYPLLCCSTFPYRVHKLVLLSTGAIV